MFTNPGHINKIASPSAKGGENTTIQLSVPANGQHNPGAIVWAESFIKASSLLYPLACIEVDLNGAARLDERLLPAIEGCRSLVESRGGSLCIRVSKITSN